VVMVSPMGKRYGDEYGGRGIAESGNEKTLQRGIQGNVAVMAVPLVARQCTFNRSEMRRAAATVMAIKASGRWAARVDGAINVMDATAWLGR